MNLRLVFWGCPFAFCLPGKISIFALSTAGMLKLVDKQDLGSCALCVWVRVPLPALTISLSHFSGLLPERCRSLPKGMVPHLANLTCSVYCSMACQPYRSHFWRLGVAASERNHLPRSPLLERPVGHTTVEGAGFSPHLPRSPLSQRPLWPITVEGDFALTGMFRQREDRVFNQDGLEERATVPSGGITTRTYNFSIALLKASPREVS